LTPSGSWNQAKTFKLNCLWKCRFVTPSSDGKLVDARVVDEYAERANAFLDRRTSDQPLSSSQRPLNRDGRATFASDFSDDLVSAALLEA